MRDVGIGIQFTEQVEPKLGPQFQPQRGASPVGVENKKEFLPDPVSPNSTEYTYEYECENSSEEP